MVVRLFKNTYPIQITIIVLSMVAIWIPAFLWPVEPYLDNSQAQPLYSLFVKWNFFSNGYINSIIGFSLVLFEAFLINRIVNRFNLISKTTCLPALLYVLLMSFHPGGLTVHPTLFSNLFTLLIFYNLFYSNDEQGNFQSVLSMGFYLSMASMFYFPIIFLLPFFLFIVPSIGARPGKELLIFLSGMILPYYFLGFFFFMTNQLPDAEGHYVTFFSNFFNISFDNRLFEFITLGFLAVIFIMAVVKTLGTLFEMIIATRRKIIFLLLLSLGIALGVGFSSDPFIDGILAFIPVSTIIVGKFLSEMRHTILADVLLITLVAVIIISRFVFYA